ncbi:hypothetical protein TNCV_3318261 [Trichonephila clavipes]|nr:hypothetical protein TNCV_3318261 [Trichonephila clavipes]
MVFVMHSFNTHKISNAKSITCHTVHFSNKSSGILVALNSLRGHSTEIQWPLNIAFGVTSNKESAHPHINIIGTLDPHKGCLRQRVKCPVEDYAVGNETPRSDVYCC